MPFSHLETFKHLNGPGVARSLTLYGPNRAGETLMAKAVRDDLSTDFLLPFPGVSLEVTQNRTVTYSPDVLERWAQLAVLTTMLDNVSSDQAPVWVYTALSSRFIDYVGSCPQRVLSELIDSHISALACKDVWFLGYKHFRECAMAAATNPASTVEQVEFAVRLPELELHEVEFLTRANLTDDMWEHLMFEQGFHRELTSHESCPPHLAELGMVAG